MKNEPLAANLNYLVGRYLQALDGKAAGDPDDDVVFAMNMLYLQSSGAFLLCGSWPRFEFTSVAGQWTVTGDQVVLKGRGESLSDVQSNRADEVFERALFVKESEGARLLETTVELESWSLLSYPGVFRFIGKENVGVPKICGLPENAEQIDQLIARLLAPEQLRP